MMINQIIEEDLKFIIESSLPWNVLEGKNILITGANGFLPAYLVETILFLNEKRFKRKAKVFALVRNRERARQRFSHYQGRNDVVFIIQDVCAPISINEDIAFIIHAASQASPKYYGADPVGTVIPNVIGTNNLLALAKEKKTRGFLFISSGEVYGEVSQKDMPIKENVYGYVDPTSVRSCYSEGKRAGETLCVCWHHQYGVPAKIARPFHTYGPGMRLDDGRAYADFVADIIKNRNIAMNSDGSAIRAFCYIADAVSGLFTILLNGKSAHAYNVGDEKGEISIRNLAEMLVELFPEKKLKIEVNKMREHKGYIKSEIIRICPNTTKLQNLGWKAHFSIQEGFKRTVRSYQ